jgi:hypothetical protein
MVAPAENQADVLTHATRAVHSKNDNVLPEPKTITEKSRARRNLANVRRLHRQMMVTSASAEAIGLTVAHLPMGESGKKLPFQNSRRRKRDASDTLRAGHWVK